MSAGRTAALVVGIAICGATTSSVLRTLVVPRGLTSVFARVVLGGVRKGFHLVARLRSDYESRDRLLAWSAPLGVLALLVAWLASYFAGYGLIEYATLGHGLGPGFREAGSSLFTLGFASTTGTGPTAVDFVEAATGPVVIALQIAYLPTLYAAYNRRETDVTLLQSRAGEPAWGPEILARHQDHHDARRAGSAVPRLGALGGRRLGEPHELPDARVLPLARSRSDPGSSACWPSWTAQRCTSRCARALPRVRRACVCA